MARVPELQPGSELAGFRIDAVEREDTDASVLLAHDPAEDRNVALHVASDPPGELATIRFLERVRRLQTVEHPHLLDVYGACTLEGRCVAIAQAPPGHRLDRLNPGTADSIRIVRQIAHAVDALEEAGAESPPLIAERIWVDEHGDARLDGLDARTGVPPAHRAASSSAALADLLADLVPRRPDPLCTVVTRATDGAYLSAGQLAKELQAVEAEAARRRRRTAIVAAVIVALVALAALLELLL
jgi:hypothetical protein